MGDPCLTRPIPIGPAALRHNPNLEGYVGKFTSAEALAPSAIHPDQRQMPFRFDCVAPTATRLGPSPTMEFHQVGSSISTEIRFQAVPQSPLRAQLDVYQAPPGPTPSDVAPLDVAFPARHSPNRQPRAATHTYLTEPATA